MGVAVPCDTDTYGPAKLPVSLIGCNTGRASLLRGRNFACVTFKPLHARLSSTVVTVARALSPIFVALTLPPRLKAPSLVCLLTSTHSVLTMVPCV